MIQIAKLKERYGLIEGDNFRSMIIQDTGGTKKSIEAGIARIKDMLPLADKARRETIPASELTLALQCGGSDGYSGITANPALGVAADLLVRHGGTAVLSETPEIYGAEHLLTRRARNKEVGEKLIEIIRWWEDYCATKRRLDGQQSLTRQQGRRPDHHPGKVARRRRQGRHHDAQRGLSTTPTRSRRRASSTWTRPASIPVGATGQVAGGCNVLCFTTGRGSAYGCKPTPSIKLATNSDIYQRMIDDMDINCGDVLDGVSIEAKGREIFDHILRTASGVRTKSELLGLRCRRVRSLADRTADVGSTGGYLARTIFSSPTEAAGRRGVFTPPATQPCQALRRAVPPCFVTAIPT